jgi:signal transduction histidine kinase
MLLLAGAMALLLLANLSTFVLIQRTAAFNEQVDATWQLRREARSVLLNLKDAETAQRGYLLTGQSGFLRTFEQSRDASPRLLARLDGLAGGDDISQASTEALTRLSSDKFIEMTTMIDMARQGRAGEAIAEVRSGRGKQLMDELDAELASLDARLGARVAEQTARSEGSAVFTLVVNAVAAVLIILLALVVLVLVLRYLEELKRAQADVDRINAGLEDVVRARTAALVRANEEVQRFAYIVSHDLRSPLVNVMGYTAELEQAGKTIDLQMTRVETEAPGLVEQDALTAAREDIPEAVGFIRASTEKMDRLINAILKLSREGRRHLAPETLDVGAMAERIADSVRHQIEAAGTEFVVGDIVPFESDRLSMEQIIGNLIDNAVKYLDPERRGRIEVSGRDLSGGWVEYTVADNGRGIAARDHERIFELFRRAGRQDRQGEGLGLAFVRNSVRRLGGSIDVESVPGEGSTFRLKFPKRLIVEEVGDTV